HEPERLTAADVERDAGDRLHRADLPLQHHARGDGELLDEVVDREQQVVAAAAGFRSTSEIAGTGLSVSPAALSSTRPRSTADTSPSPCCSPWSLEADTSTG